MNRRCVQRLLLLGLSAVLTACAWQGQPQLTSDSTAVPATVQPLTPFSTARVGALPTAWAPYIITHQKRPTSYQLVQQDGRVRLHAHAQASASALMHALDVDVQQWPWLNWQWKIAHHINGADNRYRATEDAPVRVILAFDGDKGRLPFVDQIMFETGRLVSGHELPYATLVYIWARKLPQDSVIAHHRSNRLKMVVAASGDSGVGRWQTQTRNVALDFQRAFGEPPGRLIGVGVMTDSDNTGSVADAWYGDIRLLRQQP